jgi:hypothetical protein
MLKYALMAVGAAIVVALVFIMLPTGSGPRPEPRLLASGDPTTNTSFTIHDAAPPTPTTPSPATPPSTTAAPPAPGDLDAVMQRLRATAANPTTPPTTPPTPDTTVTATTTAPAAPVTPAPDAAVPANPPSPPSRWASVTAQGTRWRLARSSNGYIVSIDLGGGQTADVRVLPAFANLDPAAVNVRVDYLRDTILQNFSNQSGSYSFARDGSVSMDR